MPIYEYQCEACAHQFEAIQKMSARPLRKCPECGGKVERLISKAAFVLKGGGWYADGYGGAASESSDAGGKDQSTAKEGSAKAKAPADGDSKPAAKSADSETGSATKKASKPKNKSKSR